MPTYIGNKKINRTFIGNQAINNVKNMPQQLVFEYVVAAGGGVGGAGGAGGGAGGILTGSASVFSHYNPQSLTVTVGEGGTGLGNGENSFLGGANGVSITAIGGGAGGEYPAAGVNGGSGGGSTQQSVDSIGLGTAGQGNNGGRNSVTGSMIPVQMTYQWGGGGGAATTGSNGYNFFDGLVWRGQGGNGGQGIVISWNPINSGRLGDGGGAGESYLDSGFNARATPGVAGGFTGGNGGTYPANGADAIANGAGGGGGGAIGGSTPQKSLPGKGGSGLVLVRYLGSQRATGGQVSSSGGYTIHAFTSSGEFTF